MACLGAGCPTGGRKFGKSRHWAMQARRWQSGRTPPLQGAVSPGTQTKVRSASAERQNAASTTRSGAAAGSKPLLLLLSFAGPRHRRQ